MAVHTLTIHGWIPAAHNKLKGKWGWILKKRDRIRVANANRFQRIPRAAGRRRVTIVVTYPKGKRRHDGDAFYKSALDALKHAGLLKNDSVKWLELMHPVYLRGESWKTEFILEDL